MDGLNMKRKKKLYDTITFEDIKRVYLRQIRVNTKNKVKIRKFEDFYSINLSRAKKIINDKNYIPGKYNIFLIKEPKYRIIMSQNIIDKLMNHVIADKILLPTLDNSLIDMNVATRIGKGTHYGIRYLKKYLNELKGETIYALKFDISKYFYSIDHEILFGLLKKKIKDKDALDILFKIIESTDSEYVNKKIEFLKKKELSKIKNMNIPYNHYKKIIKEIKNIPIYEKGKGLPIGNMTSQIMAIYYLNELDHYIKEKLHSKYYIRYMDDGVLLSHDKEYLKYCLSKIEKVIDKYKLKLNNKTKIINVNREGMDFFGFRFYIINNKIVMKVRRNTKKRFKRKMKAIKNGKIPEDKGGQIISSYKGHFKWSNCYNLINKSSIFSKLSGQIFKF